MDFWLNSISFHHKTDSSSILMDIINIMILESWLNSDKNYDPKHDIMVLNNATHVL